jgi:HEAT repeat protein
MRQRLLSPALASVVTRICVVVALAFDLGKTGSQAALPQGLDDVAQRFVAEPDRVKKEQLLEAIVQFRDSGTRLLDIARNTADLETKWLAIRGLGMVKYRPAGRFLIESLKYPHPWVRASAARAIGDTGLNEAIPALIATLRAEQSGGSVEQTSHALAELGATEAIPTLKRTAAGKAAQHSVQTRVWVVQAIGQLGSRDEVTFLASFLDDKDSLVARIAAKGIEHITGEDFGLPRGEGPQNPSAGIKCAMDWWSQNKEHFHPIGHAARRSQPKMRTNKRVHRSPHTSD